MRAIKRLLRGYSEQPYITKFENLAKMNNFLKNNLTKLIQGEILKILKH